jgi:UDP-N-acetylmuramate dehydrogenase
VHLDVAAGEPWDELVARAVVLGLAGLECLSGIPGEVGAAPIQNIGAYGQEVSETITSVRAIDRETRALVELDAGALGFGYRDSVFKREAADRYVVTRVRFALRPGEPATVRYAELAQRLAASGAASPPSLAEVRAAVIALRRGKSMLFDPEGENGRSAGSFFTNVTLDAPAFSALEASVAAALVLAPGERVPRFPAPAGHVKVPAAWLIERAGFAKGVGEGRVGLSTRHTLAIVNRGGATAGEIVAFARRVRAQVQARFGVALTPEPVLWGFTPEELEGLVPAGPAARPGAPG